MQKSSIIKSVSPSEMHSIMHQLELFKIGVLSLNLDILNGLFHDRYLYFGGKTRYEAKKMFEVFFDQALPSEVLSHEAKVMFNVKSCNIQVALMFHHGYWPILNPTENEAKAFVFEFTNGILSGIEFSNEVCSEERLEELCKLN
jgi:hypothetical protein